MFLFADIMMVVCNILQNFWDLINNFKKAAVYKITYKRTVVLLTRPLYFEDEI